MLFFKFYLVFNFPFTGDEAYFVQWGTNLSGGYYDHTPMVGWINHALSFIVNDYRFFRTFSLLTTILGSFFIYRVSHDTERGKWASFVWWVSPSSLFLAPMLNDTCLLFFGILSYLWFEKWRVDPKRTNAFICGIFLGLAFLSKYLAVLIGVGYLVSLALNRIVKLTQFLVFLFLGVAPFVIWNFIWNQQNCWNNIMFNLLNRQMTQAEGRPDLFLLSLIGLLTPPVAFEVFKLWQRRSRGHNHEISERLWIFLAPCLIIALMSLKRIVGLHWLLVFLVPCYVLISSTSLERLRRIAKYSGMLSVGLMGIIVIVLENADTLVQKFSLTSSQLDKNAYFYSMHPSEFCGVLDELVPKDFELAVSGYPPSAILEHICAKHLPILFATGVYGRECDKRDQIALLGGKDIALYVDSGVAERYGSFFESFTVVSKLYRDTKVTLLLGRNFNFLKYRDEVLRTIAKSYYSPPSWLPSGRCYFMDRYFPDGIEADLSVP